MLVKLVLVVCLWALTAVLGAQPDYLWMPFTGEIPDHAFLAGSNDGQTGVYLGKARHESDVLPGYVHQGEKSISVTTNRYVHTVNDGITVMCTRNPQQYQWVQINSWRDVPTGDGVHLVECGQERGVTLKTARLLHQGVYIIGKVYFFHPINLMAEFVYNGNYFQDRAFEMLVYRYETCQ